MIRAVLDTNVLVSGLISPGGNEALIMLAIHQGLLRPCFSEDMLEEYGEVLRTRAAPEGAAPIGALDHVGPTTKARAC
ncbi:MAG: putative toxin-antitoxin system toxin component, PIN family [Rhodospirillales bacterium]|nr:putative toxin-antitoxin system toxin component, PIN family [Rhodospirillales bacterium]